MKFSSYFDKDLIFTSVEGTTKKEVIQNMIDKIAKEDRQVKERKDEIEKAVIKREMEISTAIGKGIGIPHGRICDFNDIIVAIGIIEKPFKIQIEGTKKEDELEIIFLIISDALKNKNILKIMSSISKIAIKNKPLLDRIKKSKNPKEIIEIIEEAKIEFGHKITADDVLSPDILPVEEDTTLDVVANRLITEHMSGIPVVDKENNFLGEITERELIGFGMPQYISVMEGLNFLTVGEPFEEYLLKEETTIIKDIYRKKEDVYIIDRETPIMEICFIMVNKGTTRIYVVDNGKYHGIIRRHDIIKKVLHI